MSTNNKDRQLKDDLHGILKKHNLGFDEAIQILDEMFYDNYNSAGRTIAYTGSPVSYYKTEHYTKGNSE